jgi:hypothetical protein
MPTASALVLHDDDNWYLVQLLSQHGDRATGDWRCGVAYTFNVACNTSGWCKERVLAGQCVQVQSDRSAPGRRVL